MSSDANYLLPFYNVQRHTPPQAYQSQGALPPGELAPQWFSTRDKPSRMGNAADIAYGGYALSIAIFTAIVALENSREGDLSSSTSPAFVVYSAQGNYLRPAFCDRNFIIRVGTVRNTRTFKTQEVRVYQSNSKDGHVLDLCLTATVDLMAATGRDNSLLSFGTKPTPPKGAKTVMRHSVLPATLDQWSKLPEKIGQTLKATFVPWMRGFEAKASTTEGIWGENAVGMLKKIKTSQHEVDQTEKRGYDWLKARGNFQSADEGYLPYSVYAANVALLAWMMDGSLSFSPLSFNNYFLDDVKACASLDFALHIHEESDIGILSADSATPSSWFLREIKTLHSGYERTFSEGRFFRDLDSEGTQSETDFNTLRCVATMSQASVMKSWPAERDGKAKL